MGAQQAAPEHDPNEALALNTESMAAVEENLEARDSGGAAAPRNAAPPAPIAYV